MTPGEMALNFDALAAQRTELPMFFPMQPALKAQAQRALFDEALAAQVLPGLEVVYFLSTRTVWYPVWGFFETERQYKEHVAAGRKVRPITFLEIEEANHFVSPLTVLIVLGLFLIPTLGALG